jgi:hypothetical protein
MQHGIGLRAERPEDRDRPDFAKATSGKLTEHRLNIRRKDRDELRPAFAE